MTRLALLSIAFLAAAGVASATQGAVASIQGAISSTRLGRCPRDPKTVKPFLANRYTGNWFTQFTTPAFFQPEGTSCQRAQYGLNKDGSISVYNSGKDPQGEFEDICGTARSSSRRTPGDLDLSLDGVPVDGEYMLIDTDYTSYAAVYSCQGLLVARQEIGYILTRDRFPSPYTIQRARAAFKRQGLSPELKRIPQNRYCNNDQNGKSCRGGGRGGGKGGSRGILGGARNFGLGGLLNLGK